jgi:hypothetical protein
MYDEKQKYYIEQFGGLPDQALINQIREGKDAFRKGVYELLIEEATKRGLSGDYLKEQMRSAKEQDLNKRVNAWIVWGYIFLGIPGFFLGLKLLKAAKSPELKIRTKAFVNGIILTVIGGLILFPVLIGIMVVLIVKIIGYL